MYDEYGRPRTPIAVKSKRIFWNTSILCGTAIVIAVTIKVIMSLFC